MRSLGDSREAWLDRASHHCSEICSQFNGQCNHACTASSGYEPLKPSGSNRCLSAVPRGRAWNPVARLVRDLMDTERRSRYSKEHGPLSTHTTATTMTRRRDDKPAGRSRGTRYAGAGVGIVGCGDVKCWPVRGAEPTPHYLATYVKAHRRCGRTSS